MNPLGNTPELSPANAATESKSPTTPISSSAHPFTVTCPPIPARTLSASGSATQAKPAPSPRNSRNGPPDSQAGNHDSVSSSSNSSTSRSLCNPAKTATTSPSSPKSKTVPIPANSLPSAPEARTTAPPTPNIPSSSSKKMQKATSFKQPPDSLCNPRKLCSPFLHPLPIAPPVTWNYAKSPSAMASTPANKHTPAPPNSPTATTPITTSKSSRNKIIKKIAHPLDFPKLAHKINPHPPINPLSNQHPPRTMRAGESDRRYSLPLPEIAGQLVTSGSRK